jgi:hypothetical protein
MAETLDAAICVPWRGGSPSREKVWAVSKAHYEAMRWPVVTGDSDPALPFNRSAARNAAAARAGDVDAYIFMDADTMIDEQQLVVAVDIAVYEGAAALPYTEYAEMNPVSGEVRWRVNTSPGRHLTSGNIVVSAALWERLGGWDERLSSYGWEDGAFIYACDMLAHVYDIPGRMMSFDHARNEDELPERLSMDNVPPIFKEYQQARTLEQMEAVLERARMVQSRYSLEQLGARGEA